MRAFYIMAILALASGILMADTIYVPDDYTTIQAAVLGAASGDTIIVRSGIYQERVTVDRNLTIKSESGPATTAVDGMQGGPVFYFVGEPTATLDGFTITNGTGEMVYDSCCGGGIYAPQATVTIKNNIITGNEATRGIEYNLGGGIYIGWRVADTESLHNNYSAVVVDNIISYNTSVQTGGLRIEFWHYSSYEPGYASIRRNTFIGNEAYLDAAALIYRAEGIADRNLITENTCYPPTHKNPVFEVDNCTNLYYGSDAEFTISNNAIFGNSGRGLGVSTGDYITVINNTIFENEYEGISFSHVEWMGVGDFDAINNIVWASQDYGYSIIQYNHAGVWYTNNCIEGGEAAIRLLNAAWADYWPTNIEVDPRIRSGDYHIARNSPCINMGTTLWGSPPALDIDGQMRFNGTVDIGADEIW